MTVKNAHALAMRPALRGDWTGALAAFDESGYVNELGVQAQSHRLDDAEAWLAACNLELIAWYGVRVFNDAVGGDVAPPVDGSLDALLDAEEIGGSRDPYRWFGSQLHLIAIRP